VRGYRRRRGLIGSVSLPGCAEETDRQDAGDATKVFLPHDVEIHRALAALFSRWREHLARDNQRHSEQIRLRLAVDIGPVGLTGWVRWRHHRGDGPPARLRGVAAGGRRSSERALVAFVANQLYR
jgi:hypothetical protein